MTAKTSTSGSLFMVSAPSGAGKSSLVNGLLKLEPGLKLSISFTTRPPRPGEENGREYHFVTADDFLARKNRGEFLEFAEVHGNYYGTSKILIHEAMKAGTDILLEIDWQGAQQVKKQFPNVASIFILPPSIEALEERLNKRGQDSQEVISRRILAAGGEMAHAPDFEYVIINQDFELALSELSAIVKATRCRTSQQTVRNAALFAQLGIQINH
ncbi:guanylate kinase [Undibacterium sp. LX40W]|jgi:guanylate kinase|uniref:Guanylate kinase n=1 Tax=Undibacterium nitidum TaxID=2762298 RepID=A0A923HIZ8_9BURK|nr:MULTISPECIES: guanylate kinase [Undibacterium]MBC3880279.1 guanylate kinase [Undibacterium nitidum]MBC3890985.1 guanylate kinase [Undibacterium sp. LX40W]